MTKETKQSKRDEITKSKEGFLSATSLDRIHYGDTFFFEDIVLWGIRPIRLFADALDNLLNEQNYESTGLILNEIQKKLDELIEHCQKWDDEERAAEDKELPRPIRRELSKLKDALDGIPGDLQDAKESFETLKPLLRALENEKTSKQKKGGNHDF